MLPFAHLKSNMYKLMTLANTKDGIQIKFYYKKNVYMLTMYQTGERFEQQTRSKLRVHANTKKAVHLELKDCPECHKIIVGEICINPNCLTNQKTENTTL